MTPDSTNVSGYPSRRRRAGLAVVLSVLLFWSNAVLAAWCSDPTVHWLHPGQDQIGLQSKGAPGHRETVCKLIPANRMQTFPTKTIADGNDSSSSDACVDSFVGCGLKAWQTSDLRTASKLFIDIAAPPLYLVYHRLLLPFAT